MADSISVTYTSAITIVDTFTGFVSSADNTVTWNGLNEAATYTGSTTVAVSKYAIFAQAMSGGAVTLNLAALPGLNADQTVVGTGLRVQLMKLTNPATNANKITITKGASNGYGLDAAGSSWTAVLDPGQSRTFNLNGTAQVVASGARTIDVTGTGAQVLDVEIVLG